MRNYKKYSVSILTVVALVLIVGLSASIADDILLPVKGSGVSQLLPPDYDPTTPDAVGTVSLTIGDQDYELDLNVFLFSIEEKGKSLHAIASHVLSCEGVEFSTSDYEILSPTSTPGLYTVNSNSTVVEGGEGHLAFHGTINMITGAVKFDIKGAMLLD